MNYTTVATKYTLDTNLLIYAADIRSPDLKHVQALKLLRTAARAGQPLALQTLNEFCHVMTRKNVLPLAELRAVVAERMNAFDLIAASVADTTSALELHVSTRYSYFDCLLLATAARAGCALFFSEDMQDGFQVGEMQIVNPFTRTSEQIANLLRL